MTLSTYVMAVINGWPLDLIANGVICAQPGCGHTLYDQWTGPAGADGLLGFTLGELGSRLGEHLPLCTAGPEVTRALVDVLAREGTGPAAVLTPPDRGDLEDARADAGAPPDRGGHMGGTGWPT